MEREKSARGQGYWTEQLQKVAEKQQNLFCFKSHTRTKEEKVFPALSTHCLLYLPVSNSTVYYSNKKSINIAITWSMEFDVLCKSTLFVLRNF